MSRVFVGVGHDGYDDPAGSDVYVEQNVDGPTNSEAREKQVCRFIEG